MREKNDPPSAEPRPGWARDANDVLPVVCCAITVFVHHCRSRPGPDPAHGEWRAYGGDPGHTRYSPLDQINAGNFSKLTVAWRFKTDHLGPRPEFMFESTPVMANGVLYSTAGTRRAVVALDPETGEELWMHSEREGARGAAAPRQLSGRGLAYWTDGKEERILYVTPGYQLVALDAKTGMRVPAFGDDGSRRSEAEQRSGDRSAVGRNRPARDADGRAERRRRRRRASLGRRADGQDERQGLHPRVRRADRQAAVDLPHDSVSPANSGTTRG